MLVEHVTKIGAYFIFFSFIPVYLLRFYVIVCVSFIFLSQCVCFSVTWALLPEINVMDGWMVSRNRVNFDIMPGIYL